MNRIHEILSGVFNIPISTGTIINMVSRCAKKIEPIYYKIGEKLKSSPIGHADGTGTSINGTTEWVHDFSNDSFTYLALHKKRVSAIFDNIQAERDIRNVKIKTKVSGFFKTEEGANNYLKIMSFEITARKLEKNAYDTIRLAVIGEP